jgi:hypothetical protein
VHTRTLAQATPLYALKPVTADVYLTLSLEPDADGPVADILYRGVQWASLRLRGGEGFLTVFGADDEGFDVPWPSRSLRSTTRINDSDSSGVIAERWRRRVRR